MDDDYQIIENLKVICLCKNIKKGAIIKAIKNGASTVKEVNRTLGSGSGDCKGERCQAKINEIVKEQQGKG
ncbi:MAG: (2Fe-2S)-binding protein [bacterium]|nr:(2Fe-2S)-binding protein [bacterium]